MKQNTMNHREIIDRAIIVIASYVMHNRISVSEIPDLIINTHSAIASTMDSSPKKEVITPSFTNNQISETIKNDYLVSLIDGRKYKTLKRHLRAYGFTPERYRAKFSLPDDYPMVASGYSTVRSRIAKEVKLGQKVI